MPSAILNGEKSGSRSRIMRFMRHFRSRSKLKHKDRDADPDRNQVPFPAAYTGPDCIARLNGHDNILRRIFEYVCPHTADDTYDANEYSEFEGCSLCDTRDLSNCAKVRRQWYPVASGMLYHSIRIEPVHYCELEEVYTEIRERKTRGHGEPPDPTMLRLQLLCRTVRANQYVANTVRFLKLPYMARESYKADLARTVSVCANLQYVDLPDGFFTGDPTCHTLRQELQARCPHIRKMKYHEGSEQSLELLLNGHWQELTVLEISKVNVEPALIRRVFGMLPRLKDLSLADLPRLTDPFFHHVTGHPAFPALETMTLKNLPHITFNGLGNYFTNAACEQSLKTLHIKDCPGLPASALHMILQAGTQLERVAYMATVSTSLELDSLPLLASNTLRILNYEILAESDSPGQQSLYSPAASYYQYLTNSLMASSLPALRQLYVRDDNFAESLALAPPMVPFAEAPPQLFRGFSQPLEVFAKGLDEHGWFNTTIAAADAAGRRGSVGSGRPLSSYSASKGLGAHWGGDARKSLVVGNGAGGFLALPVPDETRPKSAGSFSSYGASKQDGAGKSSWFTHKGRENRASRADLWR